MPVRVVLVSLLLSFGAVGHVTTASALGPSTSGTTVDTIPTSTLNEFIPEERDLSDCISAVQKPGCGSENRSDWHMWAVFLALIGGLVLIGWRIAAGARRPPAEPAKQVEHTKPVEPTRSG